jgi:hypothetical protein
MRRFATIAGKLLLAYLCSGAILVTYIMWPNFEGHAHAPFSSFPAFLVWSPVAPALIVSEYTEHQADGITSLLVFSVSFGLVAWLLLRSRKP